MDTYVVDTHSLIWFIAENYTLSKKGSQILEKAEKAEVAIHSENLNHLPDSSFSDEIHKSY